MEDGLWWASQAQGLIDEIGSCREVVDKIISDAEQLLATRLGVLA